IGAICGCCSTAPSDDFANDLPLSNSGREPVTHQEAIDTLASERYLLDDMPDEERLAFEAHYFSCEACAGDLRSAAAMLEGARRGFAGRSTSARGVTTATRRRTSAGNWYRSAVLPWAVAATLACIAVYQSVRVAPR